MRQEKDQIYSYIESVFHQDGDERWEKVRKAMRDFNREGMSLSPVEAGFLQFLISSQKLSTVVEIGCFLGYSALKMAEILPSGGKIISIESDPQYYQQAREHVQLFGMEDKIDVRLGKALDVLNDLEGPFDLCFIDADKGAYLDYLDWAEKHVKKDGWIVGDNTFLFGAVFSEQKPKDESESRWSVMRTFNQRLADKQKYYSTCIPFAEGMTVAKKMF